MSRYLLGLVLVFYQSLRGTESMNCDATLPIDVPLCEWTRNITTSSNITQEYFNQGIQLAAGFNHDEGIRSLNYSLLFDVNCSMCYWGIAYCASPNINRELTQKYLILGQESIKKAQSLMNDNNTPNEIDLINAMAIRFSESRTLENGQEYEIKYMNYLYDNIISINKYPNDADIFTFYGQSIMDTMPWDYYITPLIPKNETLKAIDAFETALSINPKHPLAIHLNIHINEASFINGDHNFHSKILNYAEKLNGMIPHNPGIGHLIHMPCHIALLFGLYQNVSESNYNAIQCDEAYFEECNITPSNTNYNNYYRNLYYCHKQAFLLYSLMMQGRSTDAINAGLKLNATCSTDYQNNYPFEGFKVYSSWLSQTFMRFGEWNSIISMSIPDSNTIYEQTMFYYSKSFAYASSNMCTEAHTFYDQFNNLALSNNTYRNISVDFTNMAYLFNIANYSLLARIYSHCLSDQETSLHYWEQASILQDGFIYNEPPSWCYNLRSCYGQELLNAKEYTKAIENYEMDLIKHPLNGWSLKGIILALQAQNDSNTSVINHYQSLFDNAWKYSDIYNLNVSCF